MTDKEHLEIIRKVHADPKHNGGFSHTQIGFLLSQIDKLEFQVNFVRMQANTTYGKFGSLGKLEIAPNYEAQRKNAEEWVCLENELLLSPYKAKLKDFINLLEFAPVQGPTVVRLVAEAKKLVQS